MTADIKERPSVRYDVQIKRESAVDTSLQKKASAETAPAEQGQGEEPKGE